MIPGEIRSIPEKGIYANILFQPKFTLMGSDANWQSLLLEFRTYIKFPDKSRNILAFWSYNWFTLGGYSALFAIAQYRLG